MVTRVRRVRKQGGDNGTTTHVIEPAVEARFVRLNISRPTYNGDAVARIYEFEVYGADGTRRTSRSAVRPQAAFRAAPIEGRRRR